MSWYPSLRTGFGAQAPGNNTQTQYSKDKNVKPKNLPPPGTPGHGKPPDKKGINA